MSRRKGVRVILQGGKFVGGSPGESLPEIPVPPDPRCFSDKMKLNESLPLVLHDDDAKGPGDSPATRTRIFNLEIGACALCGRTERLATKTLCIDCAVKHNEQTRSLKRRLIARNLCVNCGKPKGACSTNLCEDCKSRYQSRYHNLR
jgi:hypothetical protein